MGTAVKAKGVACTQPGGFEMMIASWSTAWEPGEGGEEGSWVGSRVGTSELVLRAVLRTGSRVDMMGGC